MNKIELALNQLDAEIIKNENDLSFKIPITTIDKNIEEKSDTPETTPPIPKGIEKKKNFKFNYFCFVIS
jgi:hypothetical protein